MSNSSSHDSDSTASLSSDESLSSASIDSEANIGEEPPVLEADELVYPPLPKKSLKNSTIVHQSINTVMSVLQSESTARNVVLGIARARRINTWNRFKYDKVKRGLTKKRRLKNAALWPSEKPLKRFGYFADDGMTSEDEIEEASTDQSYPRKLQRIEPAYVDQPVRSSGYYSLKAACKKYSDQVAIDSGKKIPSNDLIEYVEPMLQNMLKAIKEKSKKKEEGKYICWPDIHDSSKLLDLPYLITDNAVRRMYQLMRLPRNYERKYHGRISKLSKIMVSSDDDDINEEEEAQIEASETALAKDSLTTTNDEKPINSS